MGGRIIHRSAWKGNSANFAITEFSEVGQGFIGNSSPSASVAESADLGGTDHSPSSKEVAFMRRTLLLLATMALTLLVASGVALAINKIGH
jgi:hypothetical protein